MGWSNSFLPLALNTRRRTCTSPSAVSSALGPPDSSKFAFVGGWVEKTTNGNVVAERRKLGGAGGRGIIDAAETWIRETVNSTTVVKNPKSRCVMAVFTVLMRS